LYFNIFYHEPLPFYLFILYLTSSQRLKIPKNHTYTGEQMEKITIVTGAAGFIGSAVIWELNNLGIENIIAVDHLGETDKFKNLVPLKFIDYLEKEDLLSRLSDPSIANKIDGIIHLGACSSTTEKDASYLIHNNYEYTKELCKWALSHDSRFIYASSAATYGDGSLGFDDSEDIIPRLRPLNGYGYSKQLFDSWALKKGLLDSITGLKYFNVFGPNEYHKGSMMSMVLKGYRQITSTGRLKLFKSLNPEFANGMQKRDFVYVKDAIKATLYFYFHRDKNGTYNIGTGEPHTWIELADAMFSALDMKTNIEFIDMPIELHKKYQYYTCARANKLRSAGYIENFMPIEDSVKDYIKNYLIKEKHLEPSV